MTELTQERVKELFDYRDGNLYWRVARGSRKADGQAGYTRKDGYRRVKIDDKLHYAHRLIFLWYHGYVPEYLDHIDRNPLNNSISNLREATSQENSRNRKKDKSINGKPTSSKFKGVSWNKRDKKWQAYIQIDDKKKPLGYHDSEIDAALASDVALIERDGEFAVTNKSLGLL